MVKNKKFALDTPIKHWRTVHTTMINKNDLNIIQQLYLPSVQKVLVTDMGKNYRLDIVMYLA